jgi:dihydroorotase
MYIDPHVHCRDGKQAYKETIEHALSVAELAGFSAIFDMPNTDPPVTRRDHVLGRIALARQAKSHVFYGTYVGATRDENQITETVRLYEEFPEVVGFKMYAGKSVGDLEITQEEAQRKVYENLAKSGYRGVVAVHCEKEGLMKPHLWNSQYPVSHAYARPPEAEVESVKDQIRFSQEAGFEGTLHIAHISVPEAVQVVDDSRQKMHITCGVTPHHLLFDMTRLEDGGGLLYKMNPPLRPPGMNAQMLSYLRSGMIDWVETDHAPHTLNEKLFHPYMSGIPVLHFYPRFIEWLKSKGFEEERIRKITFENPRRIFGLAISRRYVEPNTRLYSQYSFDPFDLFW